MGDGVLEHVSRPHTLNSASEAGKMGGPCGAAVCATSNDTSQGRRMDEKQFDGAAWLVKEIGLIFWNHLEKQQPVS